jgi:thioredoxin-related protein
MKYFLLPVVCIFFLMSSKAQEESIKWLTIEEADSLYNITPKPIVVDVFTDWCGWCKHLDKTTYKDKTVVAMMNRYFYPVKINAERQDTSYFRNKTYLPIKTRGNKYVNSLAAELMNGRMSYPTTIFLHPNDNINIVVPGYQDVLNMQAFLVYFNENAYKNINPNNFLSDFEKMFNPKDGSKPLPEADYWTLFSDLEAKQKAKPLKTLVFLEATWSNTSNMMERVVFTDSLVAETAKKYFYCLHLDVQSNQTVMFMGNQFSNAGASNNNLHQFAIASSDKIIRVPSVFLFDNNGQLIERLYFYQDKKMLAMILDFIGSDTYKTMSWNDYLKVREIEG